VSLGPGTTPTGTKNEKVKPLSVDIDKFKKKLVNFGHGLIFKKEFRSITS